eukprot:8474244-Ditylum_brightwellii.AAC.1
MMNHFAGQDRTWLGAMMTVITKKNARSRDSRNSTNSQEKINNLQRQQMIFLCNHHQKLCRTTSP